MNITRLLKQHKTLCIYYSNEKKRNFLKGSLLLDSLFRKTFHLR